jgi:hypothetical protein
MAGNCTYLFLITDNVYCKILTHRNSLLVDNWYMEHFLLTTGVSGGWGEQGWETGNCQSSKTSPQNAPSPSRPRARRVGRQPKNNKLYFVTKT